MVLPRHQRVQYIEFHVGCYFGIEDIVAGQLEHEAQEDLADWAMHSEQLRRQFSVMVPDNKLKCCELLTLSLNNLE
jgi:hypothetical protein